MPEPRDAAGQLRAKLPLRSMTIRAAIEYFGIVFACAFALGMLRTLVITPWLGAFPAVLLELPFVLLISWIVAGRVLRRWPIAVGGNSALLAMGALAFGFLMAAEAALATQLFGQTLGAWGTSLITPAGLTGLAGQLVFALIPWLRGR